MMDRLSSNFRNFISKECYSFFLSNSFWIECIDFSDSLTRAIVDIEITRYRYHCNTLFLFIERSQHNRVSKIPCLMPHSTYSNNENISNSLFFYDSSASRIEENRSKRYSISSSTNLNITNTLNNIVDSKDTSKSYYCNNQEFLNAAFLF